MKPKGNYTDKHIQEILESYSWTFAKTYAEKSPHWWTHRKTSGDAILFQDVSRYIWHFGQPFNFYRMTFPCLFAGEWRYWLADSKATDYDIDNYGLINRTLIDNDQLEKRVIELGYDWKGKDSYLKATGQKKPPVSVDPPLFQMLLNTAPTG